MKALLLLLALMCWSAPAGAHRLDEYLEATTIRIGRGHVALALHLTPGVAVATAVLAGIDADHDHRISANEQRAYAEQVRSDLALAIDERPRPLRLISLSFPAVDDIRRGVGDIFLGFEADAPSADGTHRVALENRHQCDSAVYLVNALVPQDLSIGIRAQDRSYDQSSYALVYTVGVPPSALYANANATDFGGRAVVGTFFWHGVRHILIGYDHLLFGAALVLGAVSLWDLIKVVSAFTVAHSLTLMLAALGLIRLPEAFVEPVIASTIVFVAVQNVVRPPGSRAPSRLLAAFVFGLFHGLGFAGGLLDLLHGMPDSTFLLALLGFSLGIEAGNQLVLLPLFGSLKFTGVGQGGTSERARAALLVRRIASVGIAAGGAAYLVLALSAAATVR
jgi:hypothetical protein